jgi:hypothetical protein
MWGAQSALFEVTLSAWLENRSPPVSTLAWTCETFRSPPGTRTRAPMRYDRARKNLDRYPNYILAAYMVSGT